MSDQAEDLKPTVWDHLAELRKRLLRSGGALAVGAIVCWIYREALLAWITKPYKVAWKERFPNTPVELQTLAPADVFVNYMRLAIVGGIVLAIPVIFHQLWGFISPGLAAKERRYVYPFVVFSTALFVAGVWFAYTFAFPFSFDYFFSLTGAIDGKENVLVMSRPTLEYYLDFATQMLLAFGFVFELPLLITFLAMAGIVTPRQLIGFGRYAIVAAFVIGAIVTPGPEVTSQVTVAAALIALYVLSVALSFVVAPRAPREPS
jgi:sec-independent protein translocase protein TatC